MFTKRTAPEVAQIVETPEEITAKFRENLQRLTLKNDNEIAELEALIADAEARLAHRCTVKNALNAALLELDAGAAVSMMARDIAQLPLTERIKLNAV